MSTTARKRKSKPIAVIVADGPGRASSRAPRTRWYRRAKLRAHPPSSGSSMSPRLPLRTPYSLGRLPPRRLLDPGRVERLGQPLLRSRLNQIHHGHAEPRCEQEECPKRRVALAAFESCEQAEGEHFGRRFLLGKSRPPPSLAGVPSDDLGEAREVHADTSRQGFPPRQSTIRMVSSKGSAVRTLRAARAALARQEHR